MNYIKINQMEIIVDDFNLHNIYTIATYAHKVANVKNMFPKLVGGMQQDVNSISKDQALVWPIQSIKFIYASIYTHHGMFVDLRKQQGFTWMLKKDKDIFVWIGAHDMFGNERGLNLLTLHKYVCKGDFRASTKDSITLDIKHLHGYLDLLEKEEYEDDNINPLIATDLILLVKLKLKALENRELAIQHKDNKYWPRTSFDRMIGVDNQDDVLHNNSLVQLKNLNFKPRHLI